MARNVSKSQSFNLYVSPLRSADAITAPAGGGVNTPAFQTGIQLHRLTSIGGPEWSYEREPINVIGKLAAPYKDTTDSPTVTLPFSYYLVDFENEKNLGFTIDNNSVGTHSIGCVSGILSREADEKNYFILVAPEGVDAIGSAGNSTNVKVMGVGNGVISSYSVEGSVGDYPTVSVTVEGLNIRGYDAAPVFPTPAIDTEAGTQLSSFFDLGVGATGGRSRYTMLPSGGDGAVGKNYVLRPGDIEVILDDTEGVLTTPSSLNVQSFNISFDLAREPLQKLGSKYAVVRDFTYPIDINFTVEALGGDLGSGNLVDFLCSSPNQNATINLKNPTCTNTGTPYASYVLKGLTLQSEAFSVDANDNQTVSLTWLGQIGGPADNTNNLFMSGFTSYSNGSGVL